MQVADDGSNWWGGEGNKQAHLVENWPPQKIQLRIDQLIMHPPVKKP